MSGRTKLNRKQQKLIAAMLTEPTLAAAAEKAGISPATLYRWQRSPEFQAAYQAASRQVVDRSLARLQRSSDAAVDALERNLRCGRPAAEIRAALGILDQVGRLDLDRRQLMTMKQVFQLWDRMVEIIHRHVSDDSIIDRIRNDLNEVRDLGPPGG
jgi:hypothetical protein